MKIEFLPISHTREEIQMGHCLWFSKAPTKAVISATANSHGFTTLNAIARSYGWDYDLIEAASNVCNEANEVAILSQLDPMLVMVPKTKADKSVMPLFDDLFKALNSLEIKTLHLTHFGFIQSKNTLNEIYAILTMLLNPTLNSTVGCVYLDIDSRIFADVVSRYESLVGDYI